MNRYIYIILSLFLCFTKGMSQSTYPVQVNVHLLPPYSLYLSDYYSGTREKLTVTLVNRDQFKPSVNVRLRMIITAPGGIRIQTNDNAYVEPITVETGAPVRLTQDDLAPYFQPNNLITQGYLAAGKLPEGMVEFCFQAIEIYTGQVLSASTCTRAWITSQKPPLLSLPRNNESIAFREPLNVLFQWTPLHQGLALVEYDFILKELWDNGMTPQAAFPYSPEIYRETTRSTSLIYGAMQPPLLPGKRYAWCIQAKAREGLDEVNLFQNDGYSEIRWFNLNDNCAAPQVLTATAERKRLNLEWNTLPEYIGFIVSYRLKSSSGETQAEWKEQQIQEPNTILYGLQDGGTYEYRIASMCMAGQPVYTPVFFITLPEADSARLAQCGIMPDVNLSNQEPIKELKTSEEFKAGDFPITITRISGSNGTFTGVGWTIIPWLNDAKIAVEFNEIVINTDRQMISGFVEAMYDKNEGQIANLDEVFEGGFDVGSVKTGLTKTDYKFDFSIPGVESFVLNDADELIITDSEGVPHTVGPPAPVEGQGNEGNKVVVFPMTVQDKNGDVYKVEKVPGPDGQDVAKATYLGNIGAPLPPGSFDPTQLNGDKAIVTFTKGDGKYGFDTWQPYYGSISLIKDKYQKLYTDYYAPWKLVPAGQSDKISATIVIKDESIKPELVIFKTPTGTTYRAERNGNGYMLQVTSGPEGDVQELYALYPRENDKYYTLGKIGIATYAQQNYSVVLVPVNNAPVDVVEIKQQLADTYGPVAVTWNVTTAENLPYEGSDQLMKNSTGLSTYNDAMKALNEKFKTERGYDPSTNYLFFLKATGADEKNERDFTGFMPRGAQFGYIFTSEIPKAKIAITVSHELGHGRFKLYHPFDKHYGTAAGTTARKTENIMSYGDEANHLAKWQWDQINDPAMVVSVFEGDDRSAATGSLVAIDEQGDEITGEIYAGLTPEGKIIKTINYKDNGVVYLINKKLPYVISGFDLYNKDKSVVRYLWSEGQKQYLSGSSPFDLTLAADGFVKVYLLSEDDCFYKKQVIVWQADNTIDKISSIVTSNWDLHPLRNLSPTCLTNFVNAILAKDLSGPCAEDEVIRKGTAELLQFVNAATINEEELVKTINKVCKSSIQKLSYQQIETLFKKLAASPEIKEYKEIAVLRLAQGIDVLDYESFYDLLMAENNKLLRNLVKQIDDKSIYPWDGDHYTNFIGALCWMFKYNNRIDQIAAEKEPNLLGRIVNLKSVKFKETSWASPYTGNMRFNSRYDDETGQITVFQEQGEIVTGPGGAGGEGWDQVGDDFEPISPLSPIIITVEKSELDLVSTALQSASTVGGNYYVVPAIFLKYRKDKITNDAIEKTAMITLDIVTIYASGGTALVAKVGWARRIWAMTEVAGAVGNIAVNTGAIKPGDKLYAAVEIYNVAMLGIGVKNIVAGTPGAVKGAYNFFKALPPETKALLKSNGSLRTLLAESYVQWRIAVTKIDDLSDAERKLINEQENVWKALGVTATKTQLLAKLEQLNLHNIKNWLNRLDDAVDAEYEYLRKIDDLISSDNTDQLDDIDDLFKNMSMPAGKSGMGDFTIEVHGKSVYYDKNGFPDFSPFTPNTSKGKIIFNEKKPLDGTGKDMTAANKWAVEKLGLSPDEFRPQSNGTCLIKDANGNWVEHTWHHYQDGITMFPVPSNIHNTTAGGARHSGGAAIIDRLLFGFFSTPIF